MREYISVEKLLKEAKQLGIDFGKGDPYNRLRYYTKIGWIPHMKRIKSKRGSTQGHYPIDTLDRLVLIQKLKEQGLSNDDIEKKLKMKEKVSNFYSILRSDEIRSKLITYATFIMIALILLAELGYIQLGKSKNTIMVNTSEPLDQVQILDSGTGFVPEGETNIFITTDKVFENSKIYVTFKEDYSPATRFWISDQRNGEGFTLELDSPVNKSAEFDWWISN